MQMVAEERKRKKRRKALLRKWKSSCADKKNVKRIFPFFFYVGGKVGWKQIMSGTFSINYFTGLGDLPTSALLGYHSLHLSAGR